MWRSVLVVFLLAASPALAGQARGVMQVGITITGTPAKSVGSGGGEQAVGARAAAVKSSGRARPQRPR
jgi:hypothetical protein